MPVAGNADTPKNGKTMTATTSSFKTRDGQKIVYEMHGDPASPQRVLMVHSLAMDHAYWRPVGQRLAAQGVCAVAISCRGHGDSDKPAGPYTLDLFAADMNELMDHLGWQSAVALRQSVAYIYSGEALVSRWQTRPRTHPLQAQMRRGVGEPTGYRSGGSRLFTSAASSEPRRL